MIMGVTVSESKDGAGSDINIVRLICVLLFMIFGVSQSLARASVSARGSAPARKDSTAPVPRVEPAADGVFNLFKQKSVVAIDDAHGLAQEEAFYSALVRDPRFAEEVGNVVVEFGGSAAQSIIDRYENGEDVPFIGLRYVWTAVAGWPPGPFSLGYINFFANVRAVNLKLPANDRIKVWLGDPKIDWSEIHSFRDILPYLAGRDENMFRVIKGEILAKRKKTLLIVGSGHLFGFPAGPPSLAAKIEQAYPNSLAVVSPFTGYIESECNAKFVGHAKDWPVPAVVGPIAGTSLRSELQLPGCHYIPKAQIQHIEKMASTPPPLGVKPPPGMFAPPSAASRISAQVDMVSGVDADAILYLGPPDDLLESPVDPSIYLDPDYFKEMNRRAQCCTPTHYSLNWDELVQSNSVVQGEYRPY
jgi:hypothetical protein